MPVQYRRHASRAPEGRGTPRQRRSALGMLRRMDVRLALRELTDALLPERCVVCERFGAALHIECMEALAGADPPRCGRCWAPASQSPCAACIAAAPAFTALRSAYRFEGPVRRALLEAKFRGVTTLLPPLAAAAAAIVPRSWRPTLVVPVPLHRARERQRGYNQAGIAAQVVAERLGIPVSFDVLRRTRATPPQASLDAARRATNVTARRLGRAPAPCSTPGQPRCSRSHSRARIDDGGEREGGRLTPSAGLRYRMHLGARPGLGGRLRQRGTR